VTFELLNATGCVLACEMYILIPSLRQKLHERNLFNISDTKQYSTNVLF